MQNASVTTFYSLELDNVRVFTISFTKTENYEMPYWFVNVSFYAINCWKLKNAPKYINDQRINLNLCNNFLSIISILWVCSSDKKDTTASSKRQ